MCKETCPAHGSAVQGWHSVPVDCHRAWCHQRGDSSGALPSICGCQVCLLLTLPGVTVSPGCSDTPGRAIAGPGQCLLSTLNTFCANKAVSAKPGQHQRGLRTCCSCAWCYRRWDIRVGIAQSQFLIWQSLESCLVSPLGYQLVEGTVNGPPIWQAPVALCSLPREPVLLVLIGDSAGEERLLSAAQGLFHCPQLDARA